MTGIGDIRKSSGFVGILVLVVVLVMIVAAGAYYLGKQSGGAGLPSITTQSPTSSPASDLTANWKIYTNTKFRISVKYPSTYQFSSTGPNISQKQLDNGQQISGTVAPSYDTINFTGDNQDFTLGIFHIPDSLLIDNLSGGFDGSCGSQFADKTLVDKLDSIGSTKYRERQQQVSSKVNIQYCFLSGTKNLVVLSVFGISNDNIEKTNQFLKQIISTVNTAFKFLDQNQGSNTSSWKTFSSINNDFSFKYPPSWFTENTNASDGTYTNFFREGTQPQKTTTQHNRGNETFLLLVYGDESIFNNLKSVVPSPIPITVAGKQALKSNNAIDILIGSTNTKVLHLEVRDESKQYIDQILSTFKFTQ